MKAKHMALCGLFTAVLTVCAWISVPVGDMVITLQTFGIFLTLSLLGGKRGSIAVFVYLALGAVGAPVFSGFRGGLSMLLGATGGYLWGFLFCALLYWLITGLFGKRFPIRLMACIAGLLLCYGLGTVWFYRVYLQVGSELGIGCVIFKCVVPFVLPDLLKLFLALALSKKLKRFAA
jgi:biotin transport system substrate-specific component